MSSQHATWVIVANTNICQIYLYYKQENQLILLKTIQHPENKLRDSDITADKPGRYKSSGPSRGTFSQETDPKEIKIDQFSREIARELDVGRSKNSYHKLIIIAPPHMKGMMLHHMDKHVKNLITHEIEKDVVHLKDEELLPFLKEHTRVI